MHQRTRRKKLRSLKRYDGLTSTALPHVAVISSSDQVKTKYLIYLVVFAGTSALLYGLIFGFINILYPDARSGFPDVTRDVGFWLLVVECIMFFPLILFGVKRIIKMARQDPPEHKGLAGS